MDDDCNVDWELCKENVQPLRQGRSFADMSIALQTSNAARIREAQAAFEQELRMYSGEDPLEIWVKYISWTEQNFPKGGSTVDELIKHCVLTFKDAENYFSDERYIKIWIKFANNTTEPDEIFNYLYNKNMGSRLAVFYHAWASHLEQNNNTTKADAIYLKGIELGAAPIDILHKQHKEFQARVASKALDAALHTDVAAPMYLSSAEQNLQRASLAELKGSGKSNRVPVNRAHTGRSTGTGLPTAVMSDRQSSRNVAVRIFADENAVQSQIPDQNNEYMSIPLPGAENLQKPGKWTDAKVFSAFEACFQEKIVKQKSVFSQMAAVHGVPTSSIPVYQDAVDDGNTVVPPHPVAGTSHILAARRDVHAATGLTESLFANQDLAPNQKRAYCFEKIYAGNSECSFEELRAWRYQAKKKEREEQQKHVDQLVNARVEMLKVDLEREMQQKMAAYLKENMQTLPPPSTDCGMKPVMTTSSQSIFNPCDKEAPSVLPSVITSEMPKPKPLNPAGANHKAVMELSNTASRMFINDMAMELPNSPSQVFCSDECLPTVNGNFNATSDQSRVTVKDVHRASSSVAKNSFASLGNDVSLSRALFSHGNRSAFGVPDSRNVGNSTNSTATRTASAGGVNVNAYAAGTSFMSSHVAETSMTVNSKEALKVVMGLFSDTLAADDNKILGQSHLSEDDLGFEGQFAQTTAPSNVPAAGFCGFSIYSEANPIQQRASPMETVQSVVPRSFPIFNENETKQSNQGFGNKDHINKSAVQQFADKENMVHRMNAVSSAVGSLPEQSHQMTSCTTTASHPFSAPVELVDDIDMKDNNEWEYGEGSDMTFHPGTCSTRVFTGVIPPPLSVTPFSNVERANIHTDASSFFEPSHDALGAGSNKMSDAFPGRVNGLENTSNIPHGRMSSIFCGATSKLSTILEGSDKSSSIGSQGSSQHPSAGSSTGIFPGMTPSASVTNQKWSVGTTPNNAMVPSCRFSIHDDGLQTNAEKSHLKVSKVTVNEEVSERDAVEEFVREELNSTMHHVIDTGKYVAEVDEVTEKLLNESVSIDTDNPFDENVTRTLLSQLRMPISAYENYHYIDANIPKITGGRKKTMVIGDVIYTILEKLGEGGFAKIYKIEIDGATKDMFSNQNHKVVKIQMPACPWEFYITTELNRRLRSLKYPFDMKRSFMFVNEGYFFNDGSCLLYAYHQYGTILDLVNAFKRQKVTLPVWMLAYLAVELIDMVDCMHRCHIIHGDFKPDNILVTQIPDIRNMKESLSRASSGPMLKLIDFGQSIDMNLFPPGTVFSAKVKTKGFQCTEMQTNRPWTYQTDLYGLIGTVHVLIFGKYMNVFYSGGKWRITEKIPRGGAGADIWKDMFHDLLNIPNCNAMPDLAGYRTQLAALAESDFQKSSVDPVFLLHDIRSVLTAR